MRWLLFIFLLFFCSGATALIYEVVWSKYLSLMFGSTVQAQAMVLAVFMGGLAIGNRIFGGLADRLRNPVALYGWIEIAIGAYAFAFPILFFWNDRLFTGLGAPVLDQTHVLLALKGALSVLLLIVPTVLMGGTLPLMAAWLQKSFPEAGRRSALFYAVNSLGAVAGAGLAGFFLVKQFGLLATLHGTGIANFAIGGAALAVARFKLAALPPRETVESPPNALQTRKAKKKRPRKEIAPPAVADPNRLHWICLLVFFTGSVSLGLEILASRALALVFGASLMAFATMLMAFILGIGVGSAIIGSSKASPYLNEHLTYWLLLAAAAWIGLFVLTIEPWALAYVRLRNTLGGAQGGYAMHLALTAGISIVVLGVPAALLGSVLPLWIRLISGNTETLGKHVGRLLTWNTLGAVTGALLAGFVVMPALGLRGSLVAVALLLALASLFIAWRLGRPMPMAVAGAGAAALLAIAAVGESTWQRVVTSGIFRSRALDISRETLRDNWQTYDIVFYEDGADATVSVERPREMPPGGEELIMTINGKPDASAHGDLSTQYLLAHLPILARPEATDVFVLGLGSGITAGAALGHPIENLVVAENCGPVLRAATLFEPWNRKALHDPRTRVYREDGRTVLKLKPQSYDVIISEPSNPWVAGVGSVFSREFYELAASRLKEGGVMAQWFHIYEMQDEIVMLVLRTFQSVFPYSEIWESQFGDLILLGSKTPWEIDAETLRETFNRESPRSDLERIGLTTPSMVWARQLASQQTSFAIPGPGEIQTDSRPVLEFAAVRAFYVGHHANSIFVFDERTIQSDLAPAPKREALNRLSDQALLTIFRDFHSDNNALNNYLNWIAANPRRSEPEAYFTDHPYLPIIFRPASSYPVQPPILIGTDSRKARLVRAEGLIFTQPERWREAVETIEAMLLFEPSNAFAAEQLDWTPARFLGVAARARYSRGDIDGALEAVRRGIDVFPDDIQLRYLKRLFTHRAQAMTKAGE